MIGVAVDCVGCSVACVCGSACSEWPPKSLLKNPIRISFLINSYDSGRVDFGDCHQDRLQWLQRSNHLVYG